MNIEQQVTSLELSKRLKELNVKQESVWWWTEFYNKSSTVPDKLLSDVVGVWELEDMEERSFLKEFKKYSAFTVAELGEMLPNYIMPHGHIIRYGFMPNDDFEPVVTVAHFHGNGELDHSTWIKYFSSDTEANVRAKALIWLIENGHVDVTKI